MTNCNTIEVLEELLSLAKSQDRPRDSRVSEKLRALVKRLDDAAEKADDAESEIRSANEVTNELDLSGALASVEEAKSAIENAENQVEEVKDNVQDAINQTDAALDRVEEVQRECADIRDALRDLLKTM